jgi:phosphate butyryltransferase
MIRSFKALCDAVIAEPVRTVAVAAAAERSVIEAIMLAERADIARGILVGDAARIREIAAELRYELRDEAVVDAKDEVQAARAAVELTRAGRAEMLMKGQIHTDDFLRAVLDKEVGLRSGALMSHVFILELRDSDRLLFVTDGAMNIAPDLAAKAQIILNAVYLAQLFGVERPRVAVLGAVELVNPMMGATLDAAVLAKMSDRGQFPACTIDGPFAMDNAISLAAAKQKKIESPVAGQADILLVPDIEAGNILVKTFAHLCGGQVAGVLVGAAAPIVLTSRADSVDAKMLSLAAGAMMFNMNRDGHLKIGKLRY